MRLVFALLIGLSVTPVFTVTDAKAQATCRNKCNDQEQACLKRTGNKGQCGNKAKTCLAKCK
jgi:hypothetical protein